MPHADPVLQGAKQPHDVLPSILNAYLGAIGGRASVIVAFADGHEAVLDLSQLAP